MSTCSAQGEYSFNDESRKTFKRASARHLLHILSRGPNYIQEFFFCARSPKKLCGKQFSKLLRNFFRSLSLI